MDQLTQLKKYTTVVADSGDFESIKQYAPLEATTNPSLILAASQKEEYNHLIEEAISFAKEKTTDPQKQLELTIDKLFVNFGLEILKIVPGRVSIEVDARLSFDTEKSIEKARKIIALFEQNDIPRERILIKLASTWEGISAAKTLEKENINCNMTLLFCLEQAIVAAEANVTLISPFVGRILDWYTKQNMVSEEDPGVLSVKNIYNYYKKHDYKTQIMGASFRNKNEIIQLAGCDLLTISPSLLNELQNDNTTITKKLSPELSQNINMEKITLDEKTFRYLLNDNAMATEKLSEGIRKFIQDIIKLEEKISSLQESPVLI